MGNPVVHWELLVADEAKGREFYGGVFDWTFNETDSPGYSLIETGMNPAGGILTKPEMAPAFALNTYFRVDDVAATLAKATEAGGTVIAPKTHIPGVGHWGMFTDPNGIAVGVLQGE
jgi:predicted enzyme related to lactoylglutathione lyase